VTDEQRDPFAVESTDTSRPGRYRPLGCCLGCGLVLVIIVSALGFLAWRFIASVTSDKPLAFELPPVSEQASKHAEEILKQLRTEKEKELVLNQEELNAVIQRMLSDPELKRVGLKARIDLLEGDKLRLRFTVPFPISFFGIDLGVRHFNVDFSGKVSVKNGKVELSAVDRLIIGQSDWTKEAQDLQLEKLTEKIDKKGARRIKGTLEGIELFEVRNGRLHLKFKPKKNEPPPK